MSSLKDIYWIASPLAIDQRNDLIDKKIKGVKGLRHASRFVDPKNEVHVFRKIQHWTLEIGDKCYELSPDMKKKLNVLRRTTDMIKPHWIEATKWREMRESKNIDPEKRKIGQTGKTHDEIQAEIDYIWSNFNGDWYGFFTQNCQNFAHMLFERIAVKIPDDASIKEGLWDRIPDPISYRLAEGGQIALAGKLASSAKIAHLGAQAGHGVGTAGTMGATSTGTASAGTVTAGGTTAGTTAVGGTTTGTAAAGGTTAGTVATGGTTAGTTAVGGTTAGTTAAGGTTTGTAAAGGTTAGHAAAGSSALSSGHIGLGAKAAALAHGGHGAAIGSGMVKTGAVLAYVHPVTGLAMTGGLAYLAYRGKKSKRWNKKNRKPEDMDVSDLLEAENDAFEQEGNSEQVDVDEEEEEEGEQKEDEEAAVATMNDTDHEADADLAKALQLGLVTTEPGVVPEEHEIVPAVQDTTRRAQTTI